MKNKFYSLDECNDEDAVLAKLDELVEEGKIEYYFVESDLIKIKDLALSAKDIKELKQFLHNNDVIEDKDYEEDEEDMDEEEDYFY